MIVLNRALTALLFWAVCLPVAAADKPEDLSPPRLLAEAMAAIKTVAPRAGYGGWDRPLAALRVAAAMRLHGMNQEAGEAFDACAAMNCSVSEPAVRDEIAVELCREMVLLGRTAQAKSLAREITFRNYAALARYVIARTAVEAGRGTEAVACLEETLSGKPGVGDDLWLRACVRPALRAARPDLARRLIERVKQEPWRSGALADLAEWEARSGRADDAFRTAAQIGDASMAVLAWARLVVSLPAGSDRAIESLRAAAKRTPPGAARDSALRLAVERLALGAKTAAARALAPDIQDPAVGFLARCALLSQEDSEALAARLGSCPASDRPLLAEALAVSSAARGMGAPAIKALEQVVDPWRRLAVATDCARRLAALKKMTEAAALLTCGAQAAAAIKQPGWKACATARLALLENQLGNRRAAADRLAAALADASGLADPEVMRAVLPQVIEAGIHVGQRELVEKAILAALEISPDAELRNRLLPMLVSAGCHQRAVDLCKGKGLTDLRQRRLLIYRLSRAGQLGLAAGLARDLRPSERAEALADVALAQLRRPTPDESDAKTVGVSLHGSWGSWFPRLERMGLPWELMPFSAPYEEGAPGLRAKYSLLAYPGTGGHETHVSVAGAEHLREYLYEGGGLFGICAGQFLATGQHYTPCDVVYLRGHGPHQVQMRSNHPIAQGLPPVIVIPRRNGGMLLPRPATEVIGWYDTVERFAALVAADFGLGRVVAFSPHPEGSSGLDPCDRLCIQATRWAAGGLP